MIKINIDGDDIAIQTEDSIRFEMTWSDLTDVETAIRIIRHFNIQGNINKLELAFPQNP